MNGLKHGRGGRKKTESTRRTAHIRQEKAREKKIQVRKGRRLRAREEVNTEDKRKIERRTNKRTKAGDREPKTKGKSKISTI